MTLLNYGTSVAVETTVGEIQAILLRHHCRGMQTRYDAVGAITSLAFTLETAFGERDYRLPVNVDGVAQTLVNEKLAGRLPSLPRRVVDDPRALRAQAARVAWRLLKDWIEAQLAIVQSRVVALEQILLPFQVANPAGETVYQIYERNQSALHGRPS